jgi:hypothetical protein
MAHNRTSEVASMKRVTVSLSEDAKAGLDKLCKAMGMSKTVVVTIAIAAFGAQVFETKDPALATLGQLLVMLAKMKGEEGGPHE